MNWIEMADTCIAKRKELKISQEELSEKAEVSKSSVQRLEAGIKVKPDILLRIIMCLGVDYITIKDIRELYSK